MLLIRWSDMCNHQQMWESNDLVGKEGRSVHSVHIDKCGWVGGICCVLDWMRIQIWVHFPHDENLTEGVVGCRCCLFHLHKEKSVWKLKDCSNTLSIWYFIFFISYTLCTRLIFVTMSADVSWQQTNLILDEWFNLLDHKLLPKDLHGISCLNFAF